MGSNPETVKKSPKMIQFKLSAAFRTPGFDQLSIKLMNKPNLLHPAFPPVFSVIKLFLGEF